MKVIDLPEVKAKWNTQESRESSVKNKPNLEDLKINKNFNDDTISISNEAKDLLEKEKNLMFDNINDESNMIAELLRQLEEASDPSNNPYDSFIKCIQIAMRIMNGDKVPRKDEKFLLENEPQMYSNALLLRRQNDKPKEYDSLLEDEKDDSNDGTSTVEFKVASESPSVEVASTDNIETPPTIES